MVFLGKFQNSYIVLMSPLSFGLFKHSSYRRLDLHIVRRIFAILTPLKSREMRTDSSLVLGLTAVTLKISVQDLAALLAPCQLPVITVQVNTVEV